MTKIIQFPDNRVKHSFIFITHPMLKGLATARNKESHTLSFTRTNLEGAFKPLYKNGLIDVKNIIENGKKKNVWYVTNLGKKALQISGN